MNGTEAFPGMRRNPVLWVQPNNFSTANSTHYCKDSPALAVYIFFVLHGTLITWHPQGTTATAKHGQAPGRLSQLWKAAAPGGTEPVWRARWRRGCWGRCRTPPARGSALTAHPGGRQRGARSQRGTAPFAPRAGSAPGTAPPRLAPHLASGSRRCAGALRGSAGPGWSAVRCAAAVASPCTAARPAPTPLWAAGRAPLSISGAGARPRLAPPRR